MSEIRLRRPPPAFGTVQVVGVERVGARLVRLGLAGPGVAGMHPGVAASVRLLVPTPQHGTAVPAWNGNEFRHADGSRPAIRTLTPLAPAVAGSDLDVAVVLHGEGPLSTWAANVRAGAQASLSGPGRGYDLDPTAARFVLAGDESAVPAIGQLLAALPPAAAVTVLVEVAAPDGRVDLPGHPGAAVTWLDATPGAPPGSALVDAVVATPIDAGDRVWVAGEAAAVQRIRRDLFAGRGLDRSCCTVRGYWKVGRGGDPD